MAGDVSSQDEELSYVTRVQERYSDMLMEKPHVIGVGVGLQQRTDPGLGSPSTLSPGVANRTFFPPAPADDSDEIRIMHYCLVVMVTEALLEDALPAEDRIPDQLEGVPIEVRVIGTPTAQ
jgi:hypothetical protein